MRIFGLTLIVIAYILIFVSLITYIVFYFLKKYRACIIFEKITFLIAIFSTAVESWALVLMNKGFDFNLEADLDIDYSYGLIIIIPCFIILIVFSRLIHKYKESENIYFKIGDFLLPIMTAICITFSTFVLFFGWSYYFDYIKVVPESIL